MWFGPLLLAMRALVWQPFDAGGPPDAQGAPIAIRIDAREQRFIGGVSTLDRDRYITLHNPVCVPDAALRNYVLDTLDARPAREIGRITSVASQLEEDPDRPGYVSQASILHWMEQHREEQIRHTRWGVRKQTGLFAACAKGIWPQYMMMLDGREMPWLPRNPQALAEFMLLYFEHVPQFTSRDQLLFEVVNEPNAFMGQGAFNTQDVVELHTVAAERIRRRHPVIRVGEPTDCWPSYALNDFGVCDWFMKPFLDNAGAAMDFVSIHVYDHYTDNPAIGKPEEMRTAAGTDAILDLIEAHSHARLGVVKPFVISEYGGMVDGLKAMSAAEREARHLRSILEKMMVFLERPDRMLLTVPFLLDHAPWDPSYPYVLFRAAGGGFEKTHLTRFYELWHGVEGARVACRSNSPVVQVQAFRGEKGLFVCLNNLLGQDAAVTLDLAAPQCDTKRAAIRRLRLDSTPDYEESGINGRDCARMVLGPFEFAVLHFATTEDWRPESAANEVTFYAKATVAPVDRHGIAELSVPVDTAGAQWAQLRFSYAAPDATEPPCINIRFNGNSLAVPEAEAGRVFEGWSSQTIEAPVETLRSENCIVFECRPAVTRVSSCALTVAYSVPVQTASRSPD